MFSIGPRPQASLVPALKKRCVGLLLAVMILAAAAIRIFQLGRESLFYDELYTVWAIRLPLKTLIWEVPASGHPPLYYLVSHYWFALGSSDAWVRSVSWAAGVMTVFFIYLAGKELLSRAVGLWAAALASVSPFLIWHSRDATDYSWLIAISTLSLYFLVRSARRGGWANWAAYVIVSAAALFSHYYAIFLLLGEASFFLIVYGWRHQSWRPWLLSQVALLAVLPPWALYNQGAARWAGFETPSLVEIIKGVYRAPTILIKGYFELPGGSVTNKLIVIAAVMAATGLFVLSPDFRKRFKGRTPLALAVLILVLVAGPVIIQLIRSDVIAGRYYAIAETPFLLLAAAVIAAAPRRATVILGAASLLGLFLISGYEVLNRRFPDMRSALSVIQQQQHLGDWLLCFPLHHCVVGADHYLPQPPPLAGGVIPSSDPSKVYFGPPGTIWSGYSGGYDSYDAGEKLVVLDGRELEDRLNFDLAGAERVWVLVGDGGSPDYPRGDKIFTALAVSWQEQQSWDVSPFVVKLYVRREPAAGGAATTG